MKFFLTTAAIIAATTALLTAPIVVAADMTNTTDPAQAIVDFVNPFGEGYLVDDEAATATDADAEADTSRQLQRVNPKTVKTIVKAAKVAAELAPLLAGLRSSKDCYQTACWISTSSQGCADSAADQVQAQIMQGRDGYAKESVRSNGMWARYWRTKFHTDSRGDIMTGTCMDGASFSVSNCQSPAGRVHC